MLDRTKNKFTAKAPTPGEAASGVTPAGTSVRILGFSTSNYDAMIKFLRDFGFEVAENPYGDQLVPFFEHGRGARASRGGLEFQLEESVSTGVAACFNLFLTDSTEEEITRLKALGYECKDEVSLYGEFHTFHTPDGGVFVL